jgi:O-antigen ligase
VAVGILTRAAFGWVAAVALAGIVAWATARFAPRVLVASLVASSAFVPSGLVTDSTHYLPVAVTAGAIAIRVAFGWWRGKKLARPLAEPVALAVAIYIGWAALATIFSIDRRTSATYWVGMVAVCALVFWVIPLIAGARQDREFLLAVLGAIGVVVASTVYVLSPIGAVTIFGRRVSDYQLIDLTVAGHSTGLYFGKSAGLFGAPLEPSVIMVMAILALLGWTSARTGRWMWAGRIAIVFIVPAVLITLDRSAWLAAIISAGVFAALPPARRSAAVISAVVCLIFAIAFVGVLANGFGANAVRSNGCSTNCPTTAAPGGDEAPVRGGTGLSGREFLWKASLQAIEKRPIFGYGPGNNVPAIAPYLSGTAAVLFKGLTSHSTWFRTAVEEGVPGLLLLLGVLGAATWVFLRGPREPRGPTDRRTGIPDPTKVTLAVSMLGMLGVMTFESFFLGGVNFSNLYLAVAVALMLPSMTLAQLRNSLSRRA